MRTWTWMAAAAAALAPCAAHADDDPQQWTTLQVTKALGEHWRVQEELVFRFSDKREGLYEIESNTLVGYQFTKGDGPKVTLWAGYTHDPQYTGTEFTVMEHRAREQLTVDDFAKLFGGKLSGRLRLEQRWREGFAGTGWRVRPYIRFVHPLLGKTNLVLSHESFVDLNKSTFQTVGGEERMRNLIAVSTPLDKRTTAEFGYLNQQTFVPTGEAEDDHVLHIQLAYKF